MGKPPKKPHPERDPWVDPEDPTNHKLIGWKVWYADGSEYRSSEWKWKDIPQDGIAIVKKYFKDFNMLGTEWEIQTEIVGGQSLYILNENEIPKSLPKAIKKGRWMLDENFHPLLDFARAEKEVIKEMI